jgi:hypothetical protein
MNDPRVVELRALAQEEVIELPYPVDLIVWFEDGRYVVNLNTGTIYRSIDVTPTGHIRAMVHLFSEAEGDISI